MPNSIWPQLESQLSLANKVFEILVRLGYEPPDKINLPSVLKVSQSSIDVWQQGDTQIPYTTFHALWHAFWTTLSQHRYQR